jgi:putative transcriptional regulator
MGGHVLGVHFEKFELRSSNFEIDVAPPAHLTVLPVLRSIAALCLVVATIIASGLVARAASSAAAPQRRPARELAAGKMLVAARTMGDGTFAGSVILLFAYSPDGAAGLVINKRSTVPVSRALPDLRMPNGPAPVLFLGGPVAMTDVRALVRASAPLASAHRILKDVFLLTTTEAMDREVEGGALMTRIRLYAGYAGWAPGQLEREVLRGSWLIVDGDGDVVFDPNPDTLWRREIRLADVIAA